MSDWNLQHTRWFHAVNSAALLEEAITVLDRINATTETETEKDFIPVIGIEADIRLSPPDVLPTCQPIMMHDEVTPANCSESHRADLLTLWAFFDRIAKSQWFTCREAVYLSQHRSTQKEDAIKKAPSDATPAPAPAPPKCRLIIKLDFKDPRAARCFAKRVASWPPESTCSLARMCRVLVPAPPGAESTAPITTNETAAITTVTPPPREWMLWWNADVCVSDSFLEQNAAGAATKGSGAGAQEPWNLRFIDEDPSETVRVVADALHAFPRHIASVALGLSLGWVLAPPSATQVDSGIVVREGAETEPSKRSDSNADGNSLPSATSTSEEAMKSATASAATIATTVSPMRQQQPMRHFPCFTPNDIMRMQLVLGDLRQRLTSQVEVKSDPQTAEAAQLADGQSPSGCLGVQLITFPVLYEAIFLSDAVIAAVAATAAPAGSSERNAGQAMVATAAASTPHNIDNHEGITALKGLLAYTMQMCRLSDPGTTFTKEAASPVDSHRCFITFWKILRAPAGSPAATADYARAVGVFPRCSVDGVE